MRKTLLLLTWAVLIAALPGRAELLQLDLSIYELNDLRPRGRHALKADVPLQVSQLK